MKGLFAYIRVSTQKQGERGSSLQEQQSAIETYAQRHGFTVIEWFEERETAAKRGRRVFNRMLSQLSRGRADGVVIHKIDRSARNLRDWADLGEMIDQGIQVHFANESLDLNTRGGRLSADIQAVVAADFIRNLREEVRKGLYGRLKQGFYPLPAPLGYKNEGSAKLKSIDPEKAPFVKKAFELYATGGYNLVTLGDELYRLGLRRKDGGRISKTCLSKTLNNSFYVGLIRIKRNGQTFEGKHPHLIPKSLFDRVQEQLAGKVHSHGYRNDFVFRRILRCKNCGYALIGELQKGHRYYRCHTAACPRTSLREEEVEYQLRLLLTKVRLSDDELAALASDFEHRLLNSEQADADAIVGTRLQIAKTGDRMNRLTDAYIDQTIDKTDYEERKAGLLRELAELQERLENFTSGRSSVKTRAADFLELVAGLNRNEIPIESTELRDLALRVTSNIRVSEKTVDSAWRPLFSAVACRAPELYGGPHRAIPRRTRDGATEEIDELTRCLSAQESDSLLWHNQAWKIILDECEEERRAGRLPGCKTNSTERSLLLSESSPQEPVRET